MKNLNNRRIKIIYVKRSFAIAQDDRKGSGWQKRLRMTEKAQDDRKGSGWQKRLRMTEKAQDGSLTPFYRKIA